MQRLKSIYPEYSDRVAFYAVGSDPTEGIATLESYRQRQGYPWPVAEAVGTSLQDLQVQTQSTKIAFDAQGVIIYRDGYGQGSEASWRKVFQDLAVSAKPAGGAGY
ncbi:MAG: hypothetical protein EXR54_03590 [Dehalococcoidia bacterium]|nr:hypothetical protein [Dehalococcoidia bacterium]